MKIIYGEKLNDNSSKTVSELAAACDISFDTARLLFCRKIDTIEKAKHFLSPSKSGFHDPKHLNGMKEAIDRIYKAKINSENILIFGDYDVDGICASTILFKCLVDYGITNLKTYVPERSEGYGLNLDTIKRILHQFHIDLLITVDCGISDFNQIEEIKEMGIDVIVTDHHEPPEILPDCIKINPKIPHQDYAFSGLCGAGVAYKLGAMLIGEKADEYLDFVALATVADSMELIDENRDIVYCGLKIFNNKDKLRLPFKYLLSDSSKQISAQTLAYQIAPKINAGGRMNDANCALKLFTQTDPNIIYDLAIKLSEYNINRQIECDKIYKEAREKIQKYALYKKNVILIKNEKWQAGFVGIICAKLVEEFARPVIVFAGQDDYLKGSARSVDGINIHDAISSAKDYLIGFGGHAQAAGISIQKENFVAFERAINEYISKQKKTDYVPSINVEWEIEGAISSNFAKEIELLEPFGIGNKRPLFSTKINDVEALPIKAGSSHYSFSTDALEMLNFNGENNVEILSLPISKNIVFEINVSNFRNKEYIKGYVKAVCPDYEDLSSLKLHTLSTQLDALLFEGGESQKIDKNSLPIKNQSGTIYVLNDIDNLQKYPFLKDMEKSIVEQNNKNFSDELVLSLNKINQEYDRIIYLDKPMQVIKSNIKTYVVEDVLGYKIVDKLSTDRNDFKQIFSRLIELKNKKIKNHANFVQKYCQDDNKEQFLFALKVFLELEIFQIKNDTLIYNEKIKNALTNSKVYSKIIALREDYV